jgi:dihydrofolate synthase/folylpolyglutamate synthase
MNYGESLEWLYSAQSSGIKLGLESTFRLLDGLGNPQNSLSFLHVAGTNGKGSVCSMAASILKASGLRAGLYTSPHLVDFRERMTIGGEMPLEEEVVEGLRKIREIISREQMQPTFFEITTCLALWWFARHKPAAVVLETGLGGRLDSTNVVSPVVSVITPISMDHAQILGNSITQIAREKAGILKQRVPAVFAPQTREALQVIRTRAARLECPVIEVKEPWPSSPGNLPGEHQRINAATAVLACRQLLPNLSTQAIAEGLDKVEWPGRFQIMRMQGGTLAVLDVAHNPSGIQVLVDTWTQQFPGLKPIIIFGAANDKDWRKMVDLLAPLSGNFCFVPLNNPRSAHPREMQAHLGKGALFSGFPEAWKNVEKKAPLLITGSIFLVGEALAYFQNRASRFTSLQ